MTTEIPYESSVAVKAPVLVGWCPVGAFVIDPYRPGESCDGCEDKPHKYQKRLMWKCPICDFYYLTRMGLLAHDHEWI